MKKISAAFSLILFFSCSSTEPEFVQPVIVTGEPTSITLTSATVNSSVESASPELITARGVCWGKSTLPELKKLTSNTDDGSGTGDFVSQITNLSVSKYYVRAYVVAKGSVFYGNEVTLDITKIVPTITTKQTNVNENAIAVETTIAYTHTAPISESGVCWGFDSNPTVSSPYKAMSTEASLNFSSTVPILPWTSYYVRGYAITEAGTFYGNNLQVINIPPVNYGEVTDIDGNTYKTTTIGDFVWMTENLRVTKFNDGTSIEFATSEDQFKSTTSPMYTLYLNDAGNLTDFGFLYNGYTVANTSNVCMKGWHVPTASDWAELAGNLGGMAAAGGRMKSTSTLWLSPNTGADNASGFSALPGGSYCRVCLSSQGTFADKGADAYFWSSANSFYYVSSSLASMRNKAGADSRDGLSLRCVKD